MTKNERNILIAQIKATLDGYSAKAKIYATTQGLETNNETHFLEDYKKQFEESVASLSNESLKYIKEELSSLKEDNFNKILYNPEFLYGAFKLLRIFTHVTSITGVGQRIKKIKSDCTSQEKSIREINDIILSFKAKELNDVNNKLENIENYYSSIFTDNDETQGYEKKINEFYNIIESKSDEALQKSNNISQILQDTEKKSLDITNIYTEIFDGDNAQAKKIDEFYSHITKEYKEIPDKVEAIKSTYAEIFDNRTNNNGQNISKKQEILSFYEDIQEKKNTIKEYDADVKVKNEEYKKLLEDLNKLKKEYESQKMQSDSFIELIKQQLGQASHSNLIDLHKENSTNFKKQYNWAVWSQLGVLCLLFVGYSFLILCLPEIISKFKTIPQQIMFSIFTIFSSYIPYQLISSLKENKILAKKLAEEYNHKQSLITSILGFKETYKDDTDNQKALVNKMIIALERNPSDEIENILNNTSKLHPIDRVRNNKVIGKFCNDIDKKLSEKDTTEDNVSKDKENTEVPPQEKTET